MKKIDIVQKITLLVFVLSLVTVSFSQVISQDETTVSVIARGWGKKNADTKIDAMRNGVEAVARGFLSTPEERTKFRKQKTNFLLGVDAFVFDYKIKNSYREKGKRNGRKYKRIMILKISINREKLRNALENLQIIPSIGDLRKELDHFTLMPYVDTTKSSRIFKENKDLIYARIGSFLQNQGIPYIGEEQAKKIQANEEIIALEKSESANSGEEDLALQLSRNTLADFYIKVIGHADESRVEGVNCYKVRMSVTVYTVMTGENIASQSGYSRELTLSSTNSTIVAAIEEALNNVMHDIMNKLRAFWKSYSSNGKPYKLVFYDYDFGEIALIREELKDLTSRVKLIRRAGNISSFRVWYKGPLDELLFQIPGRTELHLKEDPTILGNTLRFFRAAR